MSFDIELFKQRLTETIIWCNHQLADHPEQGVQRLWGLVEPPRPSHEGGDEVIRMAEDDFIKFSDFIFDLRSQLVSNLPRTLPITIDRNLTGGRFAVFLLDWTHSDGAAEYETDGFFDVDNMPPYALWLYVENQYETQIHETFPDGSHLVSPKKARHIISWIPPQYIFIAQKGMNVAIGECVFWLDDSTYSEWLQDSFMAYSALKVAGLI